jgi:hypothetical protein
LKDYCDNDANIFGGTVVAAAIGRKVKFWTYDRLRLLPLSDVLDLGVAHGQNEAIRVFNRVLDHDGA